MAYEYNVIVRDVAFDENGKIITRDSGKIVYLAHFCIAHCKLLRNAQTKLNDLLHQQVKKTLWPTLSNMIKMKADRPGMAYKKALLYKNNRKER